MTYYALKHKATGLFMPAVYGSNGRGWTHWKPEAEQGRPKVPRLFMTEHAASRALAAWAKGGWENLTDSEVTLPSETHRLASEVRPMAVQPDERVVMNIPAGVLTADGHVAGALRAGQLVRITGTSNPALNGEYQTGSLWDSTYADERTRKLRPNPRTARSKDSMAIVPVELWEVPTLSDA